MVWIFIGSLGFIALGYQSFIQIRLQNDIFEKETTEELLKTRSRFDEKLKLIYSGLRTIARLPGLKKINRHANNMDPNALGAIQEIYNNLATSVDISEIYIVPRSFKPDDIDPITGHLEEPILSFDEIIVGKFKGKHTKSTIKLPEIEIFEYHAMVQQIDRFIKEFPKESNISGLRFPVVSSPRLMTCDNTLYNPDAPSDADRMGIVISVPFYAKSGDLLGMISAVILSRRLKNIFSEELTGKYEVKNSFSLLASAGQAGESVPFLFPEIGNITKSTILTLGPSAELGEIWNIQVEKSSSLFWKSKEVVKTIQTLVIEFILISCLIILWLVNQMIGTRRRKQLEKELEARRTELEYQKRMRESDLQLQAAQLQLVQSEKMASLGTMAAGVAHEINNPLSFVLANSEALNTYIESMKAVIKSYEHLEAACAARVDFQPKIDDLRKLKEKSDLSYILEDVEKISSETKDGILRVKEIVAGLKSFARIDDTEESEMDVNECFESALRISWNEVKYKAHLEKSLQPLPKIMGFPGQLTQVFTNLLMNSAYAVEENGLIQVKTQLVNDHIQITVEDNGKGIKPENMDKIFMPLFTTKPVGKGTGLGLSISYGIIKRHGGKIHVTSRLGQGTRFTIELPLTRSIAA